MSQGVAGTDWTDLENDLIVADYLAMLNEEMAGRSYVKAVHNAALQQLTGRSRGSIERKHMNISAVMGRLGLPRIRGYLPYANFQSGLIEAVSRCLSRQEPLPLIADPPSPNVFAESRLAWRGLVTDVGLSDHVATSLAGYDKPPEPTPDDFKSSDALERLVRKFDPAARDARNRALGKQGEQLVFDHECRFLIEKGRDDLARRVEWTSKERGDGAGYDIASFALDGRERLIEVKTTTGPARTPFFLSEGERSFSEERPDAFRLVRLYNFSQTPRAFELVPPLVAHLVLNPVSYRASII